MEKQKTKQNKLALLSVKGGLFLTTNHQITL